MIQLNKDQAGKLATIFAITSFMMAFAAMSGFGIGMDLAQVCGFGLLTIAGILMLTAAQLVTMFDKKGPSD